MTTIRAGLPTITVRRGPEAATVVRGVAKAVLAMGILLGGFVAHPGGGVAPGLRSQRRGYPRRIVIRRNSESIPGGLVVRRVIMSLRFAVVAVVLLLLYDWLGGVLLDSGGTVG